MCIRDRRTPTKDDLRKKIVFFNKFFNFQYDYKSVMHYGKTAFGINGQVTIVTIDASMQDKIGQRHGMSEIDIVELNAVYE